MVAHLKHIIACVCYGMHKINKISTTLIFKRKCRKKIWIIVKCFAIKKHKKDSWKYVKRIHFWVVNVSRKVICFETSNMISLVNEFERKRKENVSLCCTQVWKEWKCQIFEINYALLFFLRSLCFCFRFFSAFQTKKLKKLYLSIFHVCPWFKLLNPITEVSFSIQFLTKMRKKWEFLDEN